MYISNQLSRPSALLVTTIVGSIIFTGCASAPSSRSENSSPMIAAKDAAPAGEAKTADTPTVPHRTPQLIKKVNMTLIVNSVDQSTKAVVKIINQQQGDLIGLNEKLPNAESTLHTATMQMRIPQNLLEPTLDELAKLGTVESRNITAEDVSTSLVDLQARLIGLQKTEASFQKIMERATSVKDVLNVAQELSKVRVLIEQIDAQLKNLQNQVAFSTITLNLEAAVSSNSPQRNLGLQIQETWKNSTHSFGELTFGFVKLGIWLLVYSPYFLIIAAGIYGIKRLRRHRPGVGNNDQI